MERWQVGIYLGALVGGVALGVGLPGGASGLEVAVYPTLGVLLYATFLQVPFTKVAEAFRDGRFLGAVLAVNFVVVPLVVAGLTAVVPLGRAVLLGVLLTLLAPCVDYVIVFTGVAGGDSRRLLAAAPVLMLVQMVVLPGLLWVFLGAELGDVVDIGPFVEALVLLIVLPLGLAWATEALAARGRVGRVVTSAMGAAVVPLMAATLVVVVGGQVPKLRGQVGAMVAVVPVFVAFLLVMGMIGVAVGRVMGFDAGRARALVFTGATRNSLVVLPLALALPVGFEVTPVVVVTQTLVELLGMVLFVRVVPRLVR